MLKMVEEHDPLKQGLKHGNVIGFHRYVDEVEEHDPLKQGLKLICICFCERSSIVEEHDPLKQGLKLNCTLNLCGCSICRRA